MKFLPIHDVFHVQSIRWQISHRFVFVHFGLLAVSRFIEEREFQTRIGGQFWRISVKEELNTRFTKISKVHRGSSDNRIAKIRLGIN